MTAIETVPRTIGNGYMRRELPLFLKSLGMGSATYRMVGSNLDYQALKHESSPNLRDIRLICLAANDVGLHKSEGILAEINQLRSSGDLSNAMVIVFSTEDIAIGEEQPRVDYWKSLGANDFLVMLINHSDLMKLLQ